MRRVIQSKLLIVFFAAFLCVNLSGSLSLVYCQVKADDARDEHCPFVKIDKENCPKTTSDIKRDVHLIKHANGGEKIDCCFPAISFFAAPLEKNQTAFQRTANIDFSIFRPVLLEKFQYPSSYSYRSPLFGHQKSRLKNCVFRI